MKKNIIYVLVMLFLVSCNSGIENDNIDESGKITENLLREEFQNKNIDEKKIYFDGKCVSNLNESLNDKSFGNFIVGSDYRNINYDFFYGYTYFDKDGKIWYKTNKHLFGPYDNLDYYNGPLIIFSNIIGKNNEGKELGEMVYVYNEEIKLNIPYEGVNNKSIGVPFYSSGDEYILITESSGNNTIYKNFKYYGGNYSKLYESENIFIGKDGSKWVSFNENGENIVKMLNEKQIKGRINHLLLSKDSYIVSLVNYGKKGIGVDTEYKIIKDGIILADYKILTEKIQNRYTKKEDTIHVTPSRYKNILFSDDKTSFTYIENKNNKTIIIKDGEKIIESNYILDVKYGPNSTDLYIISDNQEDNLIYKLDYKINSENEIYKNKEKLNFSSLNGRISFDKNDIIVNDNLLKNQVNKYSNIELLAYENLKTHGYNHGYDFKISKDKESFSIMYSTGNTYGLIKDFEMIYESSNDLSHNYIGNNYIIEDLYDNSKKIIINGLEEPDLVDNVEFYISSDDKLNYLFSSNDKLVNHLICDFD